MHATRVVLARSSADDSQLLHKAKGRDGRASEQARAQLLERYEPLVLAAIAKEAAKNGGSLDRDAAISAGYAALSSAIDSFDLNSPHRFATLAKHHVTWAIRHVAAARFVTVVHVPRSVSTDRAKIEAARRKLLSTGISDPSVHELACSAGIARERAEFVLHGTLTQLSLDGNGRDGTLPLKSSLTAPRVEEAETPAQIGMEDAAFLVPQLERILVKGNSTYRKVLRASDRCFRRRAIIARLHRGDLVAGNSTSLCAVECPEEVFDKRLRWKRLSSGN